VTGETASTTPSAASNRPGASVLSPVVGVTAPPATLRTSAPRNRRRTVGRPNLSSAIAHPTRSPPPSRRNVRSPTAPAQTDDHHAMPPSLGRLRPPRAVQAPHLRGANNHARRCRHAPRLPRTVAAPSFAGSVSITSVNSLPGATRWAEKARRALTITAAKRLPLTTLTARSRGPHPLAVVALQRPSTQNTSTHLQGIPRVLRLPLRSA
jgi:hypothetical protein